MRICKPRLFAAMSCPLRLTLAFLLPMSVWAADAELADLKRIATADTMFMMPMRDGVRLATDIYRPKEVDGKVPVILIKTPYDFNEIRGASLQWAYQAVSRGYLAGTAALVERQCRYCRLLLVCGVAARAGSAGSPGPQGDDSHGLRRGYRPRRGVSGAR